MAEHQPRAFQTQMTGGPGLCIGPSQVGFTADIPALSLYMHNLPPNVAQNFSYHVDLYLVQLAIIDNL